MKEDIEYFVDLIKSENWQDVYASPDVNSRYEAFASIFGYYFETCFPLRKTTKKTTNTSKGWVTPEIKQRSQDLRDTYALYKRTNCPEIFQLYKQGKKVHGKYIREKNRA